MMLFKLSQDKNNSYDTYDSCVVAAENEVEAAKIHPSDYKVWDESKGGWRDKSSDRVYDYYFDWAHPDELKVELIGTAAEHIKPGVICASFNAG